MKSVNHKYGMTGFIGVSVTGFREGSIFTDFVVETTEVKTQNWLKQIRIFKAVTLLLPLSLALSLHCTTVSPT
ncbi:hypothetical protein F7725_019201 [Dissostichus mawsoni]|uniref:Uncharacterized protein n=1 Tax=Dissostichus mawsoni TaxID=36200 RepID=A0A7J5YJ24_DISMA|nr:hypothetical protein F7725_019201 [Dissostichus mawsoni]